VINVRLSEGSGVGVDITHKSNECVNRLMDCLDGVCYQPELLQLMKRKNLFSKWKIDFENL